MLEKEFKYYIENQIEFLKKYNGKFLVIKNQEIKGAYDTKENAYDKATSDFELGTFLIQHCLPGTLGHSQTYHSRVLFSN